MNKILILILLILSTQTVRSQLLQKYNLDLNADKSISLLPDSKVSSLAVQSNNGLDGLELYINGRAIELKQNYHAPNFTSELIFPKEPISNIEIKTSVNHQITIFTLHVPELKINLKNLKTAQADTCEIPAGIDQSVWRAGLPPPSVSPTFNQVSHCIIHHSAGSNTDTNYVEVVRNIYLYHTGVNGWDDIGYNYVIAQDGTLFHGRDGMGNFSDDNVRGAHFCGKNSGTMGVCLLGNYMTVVPSSAALKTLRDLFLWKLNKESLDPSDSSIHPLPGGTPLGHVAGHRDGCATDCPGTFLYAEIPGLVVDLDTSILDCPNVAAMRGNNLVKDVNIFPNPFKDELFIDQEKEGLISIFDLVGNKVLEITKKPGSMRINTTSLEPGFYLILFRNKDFFQKSKVLKLR